jgi:hypothetical protein
MSRKKNIVANTLLRQIGFLTVEEDIILDKFVNNELSYIRIKPIYIQVIETIKYRVLDETYMDEYKEYAY